MMKLIPRHIAVVRVDAHDPHLLTSIPQLAVAQGLAHDTKLPDAQQHAERMAGNFRAIVTRGDIEIWRIDAPDAGAGAVFLSPLHKDGRHGIQIDDVVVLSEHRRKGFGAALIQFTAHLAKSRGLNFIAWECEDGNPGQFMYQSIGATPRPNVKPFRLTRDIILNALADREPNKPLSQNIRFSVSPRFSMFRAASFGIAGGDIDPTQTSRGLQIEDVQFDTMANARQALIATLAQYRARDGIDFADIVIPTDSDEHLDLIASFDAGQNTYSGNPAELWELTGDAFDNAAALGAQITIRPSRMPTHSQVSADPSAA